MLNFKHSGSLGDVVYSLPTIRQFTIEHKQEATLYLMPGVLADFYKGCKHPAGNFRMNEAGANWLIPLLKSQPYISDAKLWNNEKIDVDLDLFRMTGQNLANGSIWRWYGYAFDTAAIDYSKPWLDVQPDRKYGLVISRTSRYHGEKMWYKSLEKYKPTFVGLPGEYAEFNQLCKCTYLETGNALEMAKVIAGAKAFVGNQSSAYSIAEGLKVPRALEVCKFAQNVIPEGPNAYDFIGFLAQERIVERLMQ